MKRAIAAACGFTRSFFYNQPRIQRLLDEFDRKEREVHKERCLRPAEVVADYLARLKQAGSPLPCRQGRPNVLRIAEECAIRRHAIQGNAKIARMLNNFARNASLKPKRPK